MGHRVGQREGHGLPHVLSTPEVAYYKTVFFQCCAGNLTLEVLHAVYHPYALEKRF